MILFKVKGPPTPVLNEKFLNLNLKAAAKTKGSASTITPKRQIVYNI